jgi:DNA repair ATPase RecN
MKDYSKLFRREAEECIAELQQALKDLETAKGSAALTKVYDRLDNAVYAAEKAREAVDALAGEAEEEEAEARQAEEDEAEAREMEAAMVAKYGGHRDTPSGM